MRKKKNASHGKRKVSKNTLEIMVRGNDLGKSFMQMLSLVATNWQGMGAATSALAMAWATLKDIARSEGVEVESLFDSVVDYYEGVLDEEIDE